MKGAPVVRLIAIITINPHPLLAPIGRPLKSIKWRDVKPSVIKVDVIDWTVLCEYADSHTQLLPRPDVSRVENCSKESSKQNHDAPWNVARGEQAAGDVVCRGQRQRHPLKHWQGDYMSRHCFPKRVEQQCTGCATAEDLSRCAPPVVPNSPRRGEPSHVIRVEVREKENRRYKRRGGSWGTSLSVAAAA